jgi:aspartate/methionine/tyrosine aminotransferase
MDNNMDRKMDRAPVEEMPEDRPEVQTAQPDEASRKEADSGRLDAMTETLDASLSPEAEAAGDAEADKTPVSEVEAMKAEYNRRRRIIVDGFNSIGLECREPLGAFYSFPCIKSTGLTSEEFCERLLYAKKVAVIPGTAFGESGEGYVRASYCYSIEHIKEALRRIGEFVEELKAERAGK